VNEYICANEGCTNPLEDKHDVFCSIDCEEEHYDREEYIARYTGPEDFTIA
jgi:hypothetical protein